LSEGSLPTKDPRKITLPPAVPPQPANQTENQLTTTLLNNLRASEGALKAISEGDAKRDSYLRAGVGPTNNPALAKAVQTVLINWAQEKGIPNDHKNLIALVLKEAEKGEYGVHSTTLLKNFQKHSQQSSDEAKYAHSSIPKAPNTLGDDGVFGIRTMNALMQYLQVSNLPDSVKQFAKKSLIPSIFFVQSLGITPQ
jgi:hypothetical protein